ncbi:retrovirus-related pol polyprotein from transposon TNT 1-94 [Tanacetum coccineum]
MAFVSSNSTNSNSNTNEADNTAYGVSAAHTQSNPTSGDNLSDVVIYAFLASQPNSPQISQEDLEQIDPDDLEEMDLQWEMAMLTIRARKFIKRTCKKLDVNGQRVGFDRGREINRRTVVVETPTENALVAQDGIRGYDWSYQAEEEHLINFALMALTSSGSSSSSDSEVDSCSKSCVKAYATLKEQYDSLSSDYKKSQFNLVSYKMTHPHPSRRFVPQSVLTRVKDTTARDRAVVNENKEKGVNAVKGNPQQKEYKEKGVIDNGCSRHMTRNKCYLTEYEDYDGGFVSFSDGKGKISGKVLLRVPRKDNIYSVDLKSVGPTKTGIKREFSVAMTPQQNGVAERKNRTLIEAARTMVLVIQPHNKTPYELIRGRTPLIDFMKHFGCPVTILNTMDHLGKFDGKADEGFFVGYSVVSKAMRVFNKRTRIVEETLNIRFIENTTNLTGNRPDWRFDVDSLTISMNYVPVVAGNQTNDIVGTRYNIVADPKVSEEDAKEKRTKMDESGASDKDWKDDQASRSDTAGPSFTNDDPSSPVNAAEASNAFDEQLFKQFSPFKNAFTLPPISNVTPMDDTGIFSNAYDDEDVGADANLNNLDHSKDQIIGDFNSAIQTRRMTKISNEHAMKVWTLVNLPNGKRAIGTKWVFRNKKDKRGIVVRNKARLVV